MLNKKLATVMVACGVLGIVSTGYGQETMPSSPSRALPHTNLGKSLADQLDNIGRTIFGGVLPDDKKDQANRRPSSPATRVPYSSRTLPMPSSASRRTRSPALFERSSPGVTGRRNTGPTAQKPPAPASRNTAVRSPSRGVNAAGLSGLNDPTLLPLHERLSGFRRSAFGQSAPTGPGESSVSEPASKPLLADRRNQPPTPGPTRMPAERPTAATPRTPTLAETPVVVPGRSTPFVRPGRPVIAQRTLPTRLAEDNEGAAPATDLISTPAATLSAPAGPESPSGGGNGEPDDNLLFAHKSPVLSVQTVGPRRISVGKESVYEITIQNTGETAADELVVFVELPQWADVLGAETRTGATHAPVPAEPGGPFQWRIGHLPAEGREKLLLRIVPRESRPFDLGVRWDYKPAVSKAMIEVQEPRLVLNLEGPREVLYGKKEIYRLKLSNTGTGAAENVLIKLMPIGTGGNQPVIHNLGELAAGTQKIVEVELTARQVGELLIRVEVRSDAGVQAELAEKVLVRRAELQIDVAGPKVQYVGSVASYRVRVSNPGTAPARNVNLSVAIPPGAKYISGIDTAELVANGTKLQWTLQNLNAASEQTFVLQCQLGLPGSSRLEVVSTGEDDLAATATATTRVEAMADLVLHVQDPTGPVPVGEETAYELRVGNRGTKNASNVEVVVYFSNGIEPIKVEGGQHQIGPGQVIFTPIPTLAAGEELVLKIHARAESAGNHVFRAEVHCKSLGARLVSEETTLFYQDETATEQLGALPQRPPIAAGPLRSLEQQPPLRPIAAAAPATVSPATIPPATVSPAPVGPTTAVPRHDHPTRALR